ncbi:hypothetical protein [Streptomyces mirabilis]
MPPISLAGRSRTTAAASSPAAVSVHSFSVTRTAASFTRTALPGEMTSFSASRSFSPPCTVAGSFVPGHINLRIWSGVATLTTPSAARHIVRVRPVDPYRRSFEPPIRLPSPPGAPSHRDTPLSCLIMQYRGAVEARPGPGIGW